MNALTGLRVLLVTPDPIELAVCVTVLTAAGADVRTPSERGRELPSDYDWVPRVVLTTRRELQDELMRCAGSAVPVAIVNVLRRPSDCSSTRTAWSRS